jgi:hypothetical protein
LEELKANVVSALFQKSDKPEKFLKVPKHEIFDGGFFASKEPIWSPDT